MTKEKKVAAKPEAKPAAKAKTPRLNRKQWAEAEAIWASGDMTKETLAEKFGISPRSIQRHMSEFKVVRGSKAAEIRKDVEAELARAHVEDTAILVARIRETKEEHYKMVSGLAKLTWAEILAAKQDGKPVAVAQANLKALETAIGNIKKVREEKWAILGLDREDATEDEGVPELMVSELTAAEIEELRARDHTEFTGIDLDDDGDNGVVETE